MMGGKCEGFFLLKLLRRMNGLRQTNDYSMEVI
jgi:hypothetical protein